MATFPAPEPLIYHGSDNEEDGESEDEIDPGHGRQQARGVDENIVPLRSDFKESNGEQLPRSHYLSRSGCKCGDPMVGFHFPWQTFPSAYRSAGNLIPI